MAKKPSESPSSSDEQPTELPPEVPAVPLAEDAPVEGGALATVIPQPDLKVLAYFREHDHDAAFSAAEAVKYLGRLGVSARVVRGNVFTGDMTPVSRLVSELPEWLPK